MGESLERTLGRIDEKLDNLCEYVKSVSAKAAEAKLVAEAQAKALADHQLDDQAHGHGTRGDVWGTVGRILTLVLAGTGLAFGAVQLVLAFTR